jgi:diphosphomevalonate decarboxylase
MRATAIAHPNLALIKYWGNRDERLRLPANGSISMSLGSLFTRTTVDFREGLGADEVFFASRSASPEMSARVVDHLERIRALAKSPVFARVDSENNFPLASGIASSASAFAALTLAASAAIGLCLDQKGLSRLARQGSGSACRSIPGGFVEWQAGSGDLDSFATSILPPEHWNLTDLVVVVDRHPKVVTSSEGHRSAWSSPLYRLRVDSTPMRLDACRRALFDRDFAALGQIVEEDCLLLHSVMMTSTPPLLYWKPMTVEIIQAVRRWRAQGLAIAFSIDAGANVHCLTPGDSAREALDRLQRVPGVLEVLPAEPGGPAALA